MHDVARDFYVSLYMQGDRLVLPRPQDMHVHILPLAFTLSAFHDMLCAVIASSFPQKATGLDGLCVLDFNCFLTLPLRRLRIFIIIRVLVEAVFPLAWLEIIVSLIPKKGRSFF